MANEMNLSRNELVILHTITMVRIAHMRREKVCDSDDALGHANRSYMLELQNIATKLDSLIDNEGSK